MAIRGPYATTPEPFRPRTLQERLRWLRKRSGLTQIELSQILGCDQAVVSNWELGRNKPNPLALKAIATHFGLAEEALATGEGFMEQAQASLLSSLAPHSDSLVARNIDLAPAGPGRMRYCDMTKDDQELVDPADAIALLLRALKQGRQAWLVVD